MKLPKLGTLVEVTWEDAWGTSRWECEDDAGELLFKTWGRVIEYNKRGMLIAGSENQREEGRYMDVSFVPKGMVRKVRTLR